jgi:hypothetical protein
VNCDEATPEVTPAKQVADAAQTRIKIADRIQGNSGRGDRENAKGTSPLANEAPTPVLKLRFVEEPFSTKPVCTDQGK